MIESALAGFATPAFRAIPSDHPMSPARSTHIVSSAALLDSAGWRLDGDGVRRKDGRPLAFELLTVGSAENAAEQLIQSDLAALGIRMEIRQREMSAFLAAARAAEKSFDALFTGIPGDLSLGHLSAMFDSQLAGGSLDYAGFHDVALDALLRTARAAPTESDRRVAWARVEEELERAMPVAWIYHARGVQGMSRRLEGVEIDLRGELATLTRWRVAR
jgi:peptide/nickel transport system substrate-binding protein